MIERVRPYWAASQRGDIVWKRGGDGNACPSVVFVAEIRMPASVGAARDAFASWLDCHTHPSSTIAASGCGSHR